MKRYVTHTNFIPLIFIVGEEDGRIESIKDSNGAEKVFKTRKAVENYCLKHECMYVERKHIFYR